MQLFHSPSAKHELGSLGSGSKSNALFSAAREGPNRNLNEMQQARNNVPVREQPLHVPISLEEQEVLCSNCYETIPMSIVDSHSAMCFKEIRETTSRLTMRS